MMDQETSAKKSLGQHWLRDNATLGRITKLAEIKPSDSILEIGPGQGDLTDHLVSKAETLTVVEIDRELSAQLTKKYGGQAKISVLNQDIRRFNFSTLPLEYKVVANIPYYLSSFLIRLLSESANPPALCVLLVQREVAERLAAVPGRLSLLGVTAQVYWEVNLDRVVKAELFDPPPRVDSQVVVLKRRAHPLLTEERKEEFFKLVKTGFSKKRKTLLNSLSRGLKIDKKSIEKYLAGASIEKTARPQQLTIEQWNNLTRALYS